MVIDEEVLKKYLKAGEIAAKVLEEASKLVKPGASVLEICEAVERMIIEAGARPAFPCNLSWNEMAAHYTAKPGDEAVLPEDAVVKLDIGVEVDGYIADTATTIVFNEKYQPLAEAAREALEKALSVAKPGIKVSELGQAVEEAIKKRGFKPIRNLSGHSLDRYTIHSGVSIPNFHDHLAFAKLEPGKAYAVEPFATDGKGKVVDSSDAEIYALRIVGKGGKKKRKQYPVLAVIEDRFKTLPFARRWLVDLGDPEELRKTLDGLAMKGLLYRYPVLIEEAGGMVAQFEHTILVLEDQVLVTTAR